MYRIRHFLLLAIIAISLVSCSKSIDYVPESGQVEYEIHYCKELKNNGMVGSFLPRKVISRFNDHGIHIQSEGVLGMFSMNLVATTETSFATIEIDNQKYIVDVESIFEYEEAEEALDTTNVIFDTEMIDINGWPSCSVKSTNKTPIGDVKISAFYVPDTQHDEEIAGMRGFRVPGMITALNISVDQYNVMLSLTKVQEMTVKDSEFAKPAGYTPKTAKEMVDIISPFVCPPEN